MRSISHIPRQLVLPSALLALGVLIVCLFALLPDPNNSHSAVQPPEGSGRSELNGARPSPPGSSSQTPSSEFQEDALTPSKQAAIVETYGKFGAMESAARNDAIGDLTDILETKGAGAALEHVKNLARVHPRDLQERLRSIFTTRLIAWLVKKEPALAEAAVKLSLEIASNQDLDEWVRSQALAGLAGVSSESVSCTYVRGAPPDDVEKLHVYFTDPEWPENLDYPTDEWYGSSLRAFVKGDARVTKAVLDALLAERPGVRLMAASAAGALADPAFEEGLTQATRTDEEYEGRKQAVKSLVRLHNHGATSGDVAAVLRRVAEEDPDYMGMVQGTALRLIPEVGPFDAATAEFFTRAAESDKFIQVRDGLADAAFGFLRRGEAPEVTGTITWMLIRHPEDSGLVETCVENAKDLGMLELLPVFESIESQWPEDSNSRKLLNRGIASLKDFPSNAALVEQLKVCRKAIRDQCEVLNTESVSEERRWEMLEEIYRLQGEISRLGRELRQK